MEGERQTDQLRHCFFPVLLWFLSANHKIGYDDISVVDQSFSGGFGSSKSRNQGSWSWQGRYHLYITSVAAHLLLLHASENGGRTSRMLRILPLPRYRTKLSRLLYLYIGCYFMCHQYFSGQQYQTIYAIFVYNVKEK